MQQNSKTKKKFPQKFKIDDKNKAINSQSESRFE